MEELEKVMGGGRKREPNGQSSQFTFIGLFPDASGLYSRQAGISKRERPGGTRGHLLSAPVKNTLNSLASREIIPVFNSHKGVCLFPLFLETLFAGICLKC